MRRITSRQNPLVARFRAAARGDGPALLLDGVHLVSEARTSGLRMLEAAVTIDADAEVSTLAGRLVADGIDVNSATAPVMAAISPVRSASPVVALAERPPTGMDRLFAGPMPLIVVAIDVQDPGNLGAIVRVAEAGGATGLVVAGASADPFGWKALRGSMGSALRLPIALAGVDAALAELRARGCRIIATVPRGGRPLFEADFTSSLAIVIGGEGSGLDPALMQEADERITIPMQSPVESLNAAVTAAVLVYEAFRQRSLKSQV